MQAASLQKPNRASRAGVLRRVRRRAKVDANQAEIVQVLRRIGATVQSLAEVGDGCPDFLVGFRGRNYLLEVKDGSKSLSRRRLTEDEQRWHVVWAGQVRIVCEMALFCECMPECARILP